MQHTNPNIAPNPPEYCGRLLNGTKAFIRTRTPANIPADPVPAMNLPTMTAFDDVAVAETIFPTSNITMRTTRTRTLGQLA